METTTTIADVKFTYKKYTTPSIGDYISFAQWVKGGFIVIAAEVTEVREKAIKVVYAIHTMSDNGRSIYTHSAFMPISALMIDQYNSITVAKWFESKFSGYRLPAREHFYIENNQRKYFNQ